MMQAWLVRNVLKQILKEVIQDEGETHYRNIGLHEFENLL